MSGSMDHDIAAINDSRHVLSKIEQLRDKLTNIARLAYKLDDVLFCLSSSRKMLQDQTKMIADSSIAVEKHFDSPDHPDCLNSLPALLDDCSENIRQADNDIHDEETRIDLEVHRLESAIEQLDGASSNLEEYVRSASEPSTHRKIVKSISAINDKAATITTMLKSAGGSTRSTRATKSSAISSYFSKPSAGRESPELVDDDNTICFDTFGKSRSSNGRLTRTNHYPLFDANEEEEDDEEMKKAMKMSAEEQKDHWRKRAGINEPVSAPITGYSSVLAPLLAVDQSLSRRNQDQSVPSPSSQDDHVIVSNVRKPRGIVMSQDEEPTQQEMPESFSPDVEEVTHKTAAAAAQPRAGSSSKGPAGSAPPMRRGSDASDPEVVCIADDSNDYFHDNSRWEAQTSSTAFVQYEGPYSHFSTAVQYEAEASPSPRSPDSSSYEDDAEEVSSDSDRDTVSDSDSESDLSTGKKKPKRKLKKNKNSGKKAREENKVSNSASKSKPKSGTKAVKNRLSGADSIDFPQIDSPVLTALLQGAKDSHMGSSGKDDAVQDGSQGGWMSAVRATPASSAQSSKRTTYGRHIYSDDLLTTPLQPFSAPIGAGSSSARSAVPAVSSTGAKRQEPEVRGSGTQSDDGEPSEEDSRAGPTNRSLNVLDRYMYAPGADVAKQDLSGPAGTRGSDRKRARTEDEGTAGPFSRQSGAAFEELGASSRSKLRDTNSAHAKPERSIREHNNVVDLT